MTVATAATPATACAWCGAPLEGEPRGRLSRCGACGSLTTDPVPSAAELETAYAGWYRPAVGRFRGPGDHLLPRLRGHYAGRIDRIAPPGPILDVGSGDGSLLRALRARGREAIGLEREAGGEGVIAGDLRDLDGEWAAIVFWHSLEHLPAAGETVAHAGRLLAPGGVLAVAMPNPASLQARVFGDRWLALDLPRHLVHVPAPALIDRLGAVGLDVERVGYARGGQVVFGWLHGLVSTLPGHHDLYDALRRPEARRHQLSAGGRAATVGAGLVLAPVAAVAGAVEIAARRGGTTYVEARRPG